MECPRDGMALRHVVRSRVPIDVCPQCHGKWLDEGELQQLVLGRTKVEAGAEAFDAAAQAAERPSFFHTEGDDPTGILCPRCRVPMQLARFEAGDGELTADRCERCQGFWLDAGETGALLVVLEENLPVRRIVWAVVAGAVALAVLALVCC